ncbi:MAG: hypothetical protein P8X82_07540 [Gemmatimonadales bacterium]
MEQVFSLEYFGVDWAAMVFTFVAIYLSAWQPVESWRRLRPLGGGE